LVEDVILQTEREKLNALQISSNGVQMGVVLWYKVGRFIVEMKDEMQRDVLRADKLSADWQNRQPYWQNSNYQGCSGRTSNRATGNFSEVSFPKS
jgi:hypothetical protein